MLCSQTKLNIRNKAQQPSRALNKFSACVVTIPVTGARTCIIEGSVTISNNRYNTHVHASSTQEDLLYCVEYLAITIESTAMCCTDHVCDKHQGTLEISNLCTPKWHPEVKTSTIWQWTLHRVNMKRIQCKTILLLYIRQNMPPWTNQSATQCWRT